MKLIRIFRRHFRPKREVKMIQHFDKTRFPALEFDSSACVPFKLIIPDFIIEENLQSKQLCTLSLSDVIYSSSVWSKFARVLSRMSSYLEGRCPLRVSRQIHWSKSYLHQPCFEVCDQFMEKTIGTFFIMLSVSKKRVGGCISKDLVGKVL